MCLEIVRGNPPPGEVQMTSPGKSAGDLGCQHPLDSSGIPDRQIVPRLGSHDPAMAIRDLIPGVLWADDRLRDSFLRRVSSWFRGQM